MNKNFSVNHLDKRKKRMIIRSCNRGIREVDIILGMYIKNSVFRFSENKINILENFINYDDHSILSWLTGKITPPSKFISIIKEISLYQKKSMF